MLANMMDIIGFPEGAKQFVTNRISIIVHLAEMSISATCPSPFTIDAFTAHS
jgi:hypothetical protein